MPKVTRIPFNGKFKVNYIYGDYNTNINSTSDGEHFGIDCWGINNKNVFSASRGKVTFAGFDNSGYGNLIKIQDGEYEHLYAHLEKILVSVGQMVDYTTQIGIYGATGNATGPHLHYEVRKNGKAINPTILMGIPNRVGIYNSYDYLIDDNWNYKYKITSGDTLSNIAKKAGTTIEKIVSVNNIVDKDKIYIGQEILLPKEIGIITYVVKSGDTLSKIASMYNVEVSYLAQKNNISNQDLIYVGQIINI